MLDGEHPQSADVPAIGELIDGKYRVAAVLGEGGMGVVVDAMHEIVQRRVAIKILTVDAAGNPELAERFRLEASAGNQIGHPAFVQTFDYGSYNGRPYLVMEYLDGVNLGQEIRRHGPMPVARATGILAQVAQALSAAHDRGIIHRDIKGENIFLLEGDVVKVLDLGIAKFLNVTDRRARTRTGGIMGTPWTMSPEQCIGAELDHHSDIYSLAVVAFYVVAGQWPFQGYDFEVMTAHQRDEPPRLATVASSVPSELSDLVYRNMSKNPHERQSSMREFSAALSAFANAPDSSGQVPARSESNTRRLRAVPPPSRTTPRSIATVSGEARRIAGPRGRAAFGKTAALGIVGILAVGAAVVFGMSGRRSAIPSKPIQAQRPTPESKRPLLEPSKVMLSVSPADAQVLVDGVPKAGSPPYMLEGQNGRTLHIELRREGYRPLKRDIPLGDVDQRVALELEPAPEPTATKGRLDIFVDPYAVVYVDGKKLGQTPRRGISLAVGSHLVKLVNAEHGHPADRPYQKRIQIRAGRTETIDLTWTNDH